MDDNSSRAGNAEGSSEFFTFQQEHPAWRLDGCVVTPGADGIIEFLFRKPGGSTLVLKAGAPLLVAEQKGLSARLRPGWDGTLGYSLYALEVETAAAGTGQVRLVVEAPHVGGHQDVAAFAGRPSRFPEASGAFPHWQKEYRQRLVSRLMNGGFPGRVALDAEVLRSEERSTFTLRRVRYASQPDRTGTLLLSLPRKAAAPPPLLLALHGHEAAWGEADAAAFTAGHSDDFCAYFAEQGWAVLQPATMNHSRRHPGWTLQGEWTWDAMVALDYATALPEIDVRRVAVCGLSTGAHLAMNMLALDERVRAGVVGCILSTWHHYRERLRIPPHCDCGILGQLGDWLEPCDWAALAAPKPVQFQHGRQDACFCPGADPLRLQPAWNTGVMPAAEFMDAFAEVERAWRLVGAHDLLGLHIHPDGHRVDSAAALTFLSRTLNTEHQQEPP